MSCGATGGAIVKKEDEKEKKEMFSNKDRDMKIAGISIGVSLRVILFVVAAVIILIFLYYILNNKSTNMRERVKSGYKQTKELFTKRLRNKQHSTGKGVSLDTSPPNTNGPPNITSKPISTGQPNTNPKGESAGGRYHRRR